MVLKSVNFPIKINNLTDKETEVDFINNFSTHFCKIKDYKNSLIILYKYLNTVV